MSDINPSSGQYYTVAPQYAGQTLANLYKGAAGASTSGSPEVAAKILGISLDSPLEAGKGYTTGYDTAGNEFTDINKLFVRGNSYDPAVSSLNASKGEVTQAFDTRTNQLAAEKQPLIDRYQNLLADLTGRENKATAAQGQVLSTEYGKRGIPLSSSAYQQDLTNKIGGIGYDYGVQRKDVGLNQEADLRDLQNSITNLTLERTKELRDISNLIAQYQVQGADKATQNALDLFKFNKEMEFQSRFDDLNRKILEKQGQPDPTNYQAIESGGSIYNFNPATGALALLQKQSGGATAAQTSATSKQSVLNDAKSGKGLSEIVTKYGSTLPVDDIVQLYTAASPYGTPVEDWAKKILGLGNTTTLNLGQ